MTSGALRPAALVALLAAASTGLPAQAPPEAAVVRALRAGGPVRLDGVPDEPAWLEADSVTDFRQQDPEEGAPVSERTVVRILATDRGLVVAFWCYDRQPGRIRRTQLRRDSDTDPDDFVVVLLDPQFDRRSGYAFAVNPNGAMGDAEILGFENENEDWNGVWDARARVHEWGWSAELLLPWQMLRYRIGDTEWGLNLGRVIRRRHEESMWRGWLRQQGFFFQDAEGTLLVPSDLPHRRPFEGRPYVALARQGDTRAYLPAGADSVTALGADSARFGFDGKLAVAPTLNLDLTINTDFAQVEADQQVVNLTRFPVFFPEKREFFLEASGTFAFGNSGNTQLFHSRRIGLAADGTPIPILAGLRLTGRAGPERIGLLATRTGTGDDAVDLVGRVKHDVLSRGYLGAMLTFRGGPGVPGTRLGGGVDGELPMTVGSGQNFVVSGFAMASRDSSGAASRSAWSVKLDYPNDWSDDFVTLTRVEAGFDPALGFVRQDGIWRLNTGWRFFPRPGRWGIRRLSFTALSADVVWRIAGALDHAQYSVRPFGAEFESGDEIEVNLWHLDDVPADSFDLAGGVIVPPGRYGWTRGEVAFSLSDRRPVSGGLEVSFGEFYRGSAVFLEYDASLRVAPHLVAGVDGEVNWVRLPQGRATAHEHRLRLDYATSPRLNSTVFLQWDSESDRMAVNSRVHWIPRPGVDAYLVWNTAWTTCATRDPASLDCLDRGLDRVRWRRPLRSALIGKFVYYFRL